MSKSIQLSIPHVQQSAESSCGAAALSMVYQFFGIKDQTEEVIWERLKEPRSNVPGEFFLKTYPMALDGQAFGLVYFYGQASLRSPELALQPILELLSLSVPIIVCQRISNTNNLGHFRVVTGIDGEGIFVNDPLLQTTNNKLDKSEFISLWTNANNGEVIGGEFFALLRTDQIKQGKFTVTNFNIPEGDFEISNINLAKGGLTSNQA